MSITDNYDYFTCELRGKEITIEVYFNMQSGGSNGYGSDEPAWSHASFSTENLYHPERARKLHKRLADAIMEKYAKDISEHLNERYEGN